MEVFHCATEADVTIPLYNGPCKDPERPQIVDVCKQVKAAWAVGAEPFIYPEVRPHTNPQAIGLLVKK